MLASITTTNFRRSSPIACEDGNSNGCRQLWPATVDGVGRIAGAHAKALSELGACRGVPHPDAEWSARMKYRNGTFYRFERRQRIRADRNHAAALCHRPEQHRPRKAR